MSAGYKNVTQKESRNNIHADYKMTPERILFQQSRGLQKCNQERILSQQSTGYKNVNQKEGRNKYTRVTKM